MLSAQAFFATLRAAGVRRGSSQTIAAGPSLKNGWPIPETVSYPTYGSPTLDVKVILDRKPPLYHYTGADGLLKILTSRALLARPTWDFADTQEYVLGLGIIADHLKRIRGSRYQQWPPLLLSLLSHFKIDIDTL